MNESVEWGLEQFLRSYPGMAVKPAVDRNLCIEGKFEFSARTDEHGKITDAYHLRVCIPPGFPRDLPTVHESGGRIPRNKEFHVNIDGSLCLGSRLRLLLILSKSQTLVGYANDCIVPFLFAISHKLLHGGPLPFGELAHGTPGELADYTDLLGLQTVRQAERSLDCLGMKLRLANKHPCPCGCGRRLGKCQFNQRLNKFRSLAKREWFRSVSASLTISDR